MIRTFFFSSHSLDSCSEQLEDLVALQSSLKLRRRGTLKKLAGCLTWINVAWKTKRMHEGGGVQAVVETVGGGVFRWAHATHMSVWGGAYPCTRSKLCVSCGCVGSWAASLSLSLKSNNRDRNYRGKYRNSMQPNARLRQKIMKGRYRDRRIWIQGTR